MIALQNNYFLEYCDFEVGVGSKLNVCSGLVF